MNLKNRGIKLVAGSMAIIFSYTVSSPVSAGYSSFAQLIGDLNGNILESRTVSDLSDVFRDATTAAFSLTTEDLSQEQKQKVISELDGAVSGFNLVLAELSAQLQDLLKAGQDHRVANQMARTLMHEFYYNQLLKRFQDEPLKGLSHEAKIHAFHLIQEHVEKGDVGSFLKEVELMEDQTSHGWLVAWPGVAVMGLIMMVVFTIYYSKEENSLSEDWAESWNKIKRIFGCGEESEESEGS